MKPPQYLVRIAGSSHGLELVGKYLMGPRSREEINRKGYAFTTDREKAWQFTDEAEAMTEAALIVAHFSGALEIEVEAPKQTTKETAVTLHRKISESQWIVIQTTIDSRHAEAFKGMSAQAFDNLGRDAANHWYSIARCILSGGALSPDSADHVQRCLAFHGSLTGRAKAAPITLRMTLDSWEAIQALAKALGTTPRTLLRDGLHTRYMGYREFLKERQLATA